MHICCPHCRNHIELVTPTQEEILCPSCGSTFRLAEETTGNWKPGSGQKFGRFELLELVGQGAFGMVHMARDTRLDRIVAIKIPRGGNLAGSDGTDRFLREARSVAQLRHPSIVSVHEVGEENGIPYLVSDFIHGKTLADLLTSRRPTFSESAELIAAVADALQYAHDQGVIHRDVKPSNIMLEINNPPRKSSDLSPPGRTAAALIPRLTDFGLAKRDAGEITMTIEGQILGTPAYMPPEQARGDAHLVDGRSDVYSLGVILYQLLTGELPFRGNKRMLLEQVLYEDPGPPRRLNDRIPRDLETICLKALAKEPRQRYETARAMADDLRRWLKGELILARPAGTFEQSAKWIKRHPTASTAIGVSLLGAFALVIAGFWYQQQIYKTRAETEITERARGLVNALRTADITEVPLIVKEIRQVWDRAEPLLRKIWDSSKTDSKDQVRAALALPVDDNHAKFLVDHLLHSPPQELMVIRTFLLPHKQQVKGDFWATLENVSEVEERRFRAACALATLDDPQQNWEKAAPFVVNQLIAQDPLTIGLWTEALRPIRQRLIPDLIQLSHPQHSVERAKEMNAEQLVAEKQKNTLAISILSDYASDNPQILTQLLMDADPRQFAILFPKLNAHRTQVIGFLEAMMEKDSKADDANAEATLLQAKRRANAGIALVQLGEPQRVWPLFGHSDDPTSRTQLIHLLHTLGADPKSLIARLENEAAPSGRRGLILSLGQYPDKELPQKDLQTFLPKLLDWYRNDSDAGIHSALRWLLQRWNQQSALKEIETQLATGKGEGARNWYLTRQGQTMMILHGPMEFDMGSPQAEPGRKPGDDEKLQRVRLDQSFAISATAITKEQYLRFRSDYHPEELEPFYPNPNCPVLAVTWFEAAEYCNWLSKQEGIPEKEWCYLPNDAGEFDAGMKLAPDYRHRTAYRLPTEAEWEYACRAGSKTRWYFGSCEEWLSEYAWYAKNAGQRTWPVGQLKPNDFGLFDMHGNSLCWCLDRYASSRKPFQPDDPKEKTIKKEDERILRGGAFVSQAVAVRCASLYRVQPWFPTRDLGFRVVRTWREK